MKTTVEIGDSLLAEAKELSRREGIPLRALLEDGLRVVLDRRKAQKSFVLEDGSVDGQGLESGLSLHETILKTYEERIG